MRIICWTLSVYYTCRWGLKHFLHDGHFILGHDFKYNGEVHYDHWVMVCRRCGIRAGIDQAPPRGKKKK